MNPVDHPLGGGEGRTKGVASLRTAGVLSKGGKTRKKRKPSNSAIIRRRKPGPHYAVIFGRDRHAMSKNDVAGVAMSGFVHNMSEPALCGVAEEER